MGDAAAAPPPLARVRLDSVDVVRGLIMVVMAIDHVRDMVGPRTDPTDLAVTTPALFLTRLVTHLCAPGFVLLAGTGAFLSKKAPPELSRFLLSRGLWLVVVELTLVRTAWYFNFEPRFPVQVIWVLGWSMVALAALSRLPLPAVAAFGIAMMGLHNLFDGIRVAPLISGHPTLRDLVVSILHVQNPPVIYPLVPWIGVMAVGYALGAVFRFDPARRRRALRSLGLALCAAFVVVRALNSYGDPSPWGPQRSPVFTAIAFFNTTKYPPSLDYLLMTLGPLLLLLAAAEAARGWLSRALIVFGRVPFFFYLLHLYLIHAIAICVGVATGFPASAFLTGWFLFPGTYGLGLAAVYLVWLLVVAALYPACGWFARIKATRRDWWLSYL